MDVRMSSYTDPFVVLVGVVSAGAGSSTRELQQVLRIVKLRQVSKRTPGYTIKM